MKPLIFSLLALTLFSCSSDSDAPLNDCQGKRSEINARFDAKIEYVAGNTSPVDTRKIELLNQERSIALSKACE